MSCNAKNCPAQIIKITDDLCEQWDCEWRKPKTNADRIRTMSDEELADWLYNTVDDFPPWCDERRGHHGEPYGCEKCMVDWLKEAAE